MLAAGPYRVLRRPWLAGLSALGMAAGLIEPLGVEAAGLINAVGIQGLGALARDRSVERELPGSRIGPTGLHRALRLQDCDARVRVWRGSRPNVRRTRLAARRVSVLVQFPTAAKVPPTRPGWKFSITRFDACN